jgi:hypothetical protein
MLAAGPGRPFASLGKDICADGGDEEDGKGVYMYVCMYVCMYFLYVVQLRLDESKVAELTNLELFHGIPNFCYENPTYFRTSRLSERICN